MNKLDEAIVLAIDVHDNQVDLGGHQYILHPLRVMCRVEKKLRYIKAKDKESVLISAVLHDVLEDCDISDRDKIKNIIKSISETSLKSVETLTREEKQSWKNYISNIEKYWAPRLIKIADLEENVDLTRIPEVTEKDKKRNQMYLSTLAKLYLVQQNNE